MATIKKSIIDKLQYRINQEEFSSRLYKSMGIWLNLNGYMGASALWKKYSCEEVVHAEWVYDYLLKLNIKPTIQEISQPMLDFKSLPQIIVLSYKHEVDITEQCAELSQLCAKEGDYMTMNIAQKFLTEQVEEIEKTTELIDKLKAFGDSKESLQILDIELGKMA